jgi:hypothetical protein
VHQTGAVSFIKRQRGERGSPSEAASSTAADCKPQASSTGNSHGFTRLHVKQVIGPALQARLLEHVKKVAEAGNPQAVLDAIDKYAHSQE